MMEKLGTPQTHLGLKRMIKEVDEDFDGKLSFREVPMARGAREDSPALSSQVLLGLPLGNALWLDI